MKWISGDGADLDAHNECNRSLNTTIHWSRIKMHHAKNQRDINEDKSAAPAFPSRTGRPFFLVLLLLVIVVLRTQTQTNAHTFECMLDFVTTSTTMNTGGTKPNKGNEEFRN